MKPLWAQSRPFVTAISMPHKTRLGQSARVDWPRAADCVMVARAEGYCIGNVPRQGKAAHDHGMRDEELIMAGNLQGM